jgi:hypothetical protein
MLRVRTGHTTAYSLIIDIAALMALAVAIVVTLSGCQRKEKVLDIKTPGADVEVTRDKDTGRVDVDVKDK